MADLIEQHPETATTTTGMLLAAAMGPDKYAAAFKDIGAEGRAAAEAPADLRRSGPMPARLRPMPPPKISVSSLRRPARWRRLRISSRRRLRPCSSYWPRKV
jgi:hypothetical protein